MGECLFVYLALHCVQTKELNERATVSLALGAARVVAALHKVRGLSFSIRSDLCAAWQQARNPCVKFLGL